MRKIIPLALLLLAVSSGNPASAQWSGRYFGNINNINGVQAQLQNRINMGIRSGRLTAAEASRLQAQLNRTNWLESRLRMSGGRLSFSERARLSAELSQISNNIRIQLNDNDYRFNHRRRIGAGWGRWYR